MADRLIKYADNLGYWTTRNMKHNIVTWIGSVSLFVFLTPNAVRIVGWFYFNVHQL
jgi:hypothetical protein